MLRQERHALEAWLGYASQTGRRAANEDYVGAYVGAPADIAARGLVAVMADGVGGHKGGRVAAELTVRGFIEGYIAQPETIGVRLAAARAIEPINAWIHAQGRADPQLENMATTFTAVILKGRGAHIVHVGDSRAYRFSEGRLERLTFDHTAGRGDLSHVLHRAIGFEDTIRLDHATCGLRLHDRFLLCSDGVHGSLADDRLRALLAQRAAPRETADAIVAAALEAGSTDNASALILDVVDLPLADESELTGLIDRLPIGELPVVGAVIDGFRIDGVLSNGRYSRLFRATDAARSREVVLKFPQPKATQARTFRTAFVREAWVAARVTSPYIGEVLALPPGRQTRLYSAMPFYAGETLEARLNRLPRLTLAEGADIAMKLARAILTLHRASIIHRDIKPDNVLIDEAGGLRLVDLGVARVPRLEEFPHEDVPGTPSYMGPELFEGAGGDEKSDLFALGVTIYRAFTGAYPYGEIEPFTRPRFGRPTPLARYRPDLPAWLDAALARAVAVNPAERFGDAIEFAFELENGSSQVAPPPRRPKALYARNPLLFWQVLSAVMFLALMLALARH